MTRIQVAFIDIVLFVLIGVGPGCSKPKGPVPGESGTDLSERFSLSGDGAPDMLKRHMEIVRKGQQRDSLVLLAPASMQASLDGIKEGRKVLKCWAAPVYDIGDGIQMRVFLRRMESRIEIGSRYFDPGRKDEDRDWIPIEIPLDIRSGDQLEIEASGGPQGDFVADWLAFNSLRLTP